MLALLVGTVCVYYIYRLKYKNPSRFAPPFVALPQLRPSQQLQKRQVRFLHVEYPALFLIYIRPINDDAFQLAQFESSYTSVSQHC
jgi:hypothetical protein